MKAFVVLCVLIMGLTAEAQNEKPCFRKEGDCGCCLMKTQMERTEKYFYRIFNMMQKDFDETKEALSQYREGPIVFTAILEGEDCDLSDSPKTILYTKIQVNVGGAYDPATGKFTAPVAGVYSFAVSLYDQGDHKSCAVLHVKGSTYTLLEGNNADTKDSSSITIIVDLEAGDEVYVVQPQGCHLCAQSNSFNAFTGYFLYARA